MPHACETCGVTFDTLTRLRLHDCSDDQSAGSEESSYSAIQESKSSHNAFLASIGDAIEGNLDPTANEREQRGLAAADEQLKSALKATAGGAPDAAYALLAQYERELQAYHDGEDYETYRGMFWAFNEPAVETIDAIARREGWPFLEDIVEAYWRESTAEEPLVSPVIENVVSRHVIRTRIRADVRAIPEAALSYLGSFWESMGSTSGEESFPYGWGIGHPEHAVAERLREIATEELFWVRGTLPHAIYADQQAAADLLEALLTDERIDYEDRYMLATTVSEVDRDTSPTVPSYWDAIEALDYWTGWDGS